MAVSQLYKVLAAESEKEKNESIKNESTKTADENIKSE